MAENFPNFLKDMNRNIQEGQNTPRFQEIHPRCIIIKLLKDSERILKATKEK